MKEKTEIMLGYARKRQEVETIYMILEEIMMADVPISTAKKMALIDVLFLNQKNCMGHSSQMRKSIAGSMEEARMRIHEQSKAFWKDYLKRTSSSHKDRVNL